MGNDTNQNDLETALDLILEFRKTCQLSPEYSGTGDHTHKVSARNIINAKELVEKIGPEKSAVIRQLTSVLHDLYIQCGNQNCGTCYDKYESLLKGLSDNGLIEKTYVDNKAHYQVKKKAVVEEPKKEGEQK